ncbi:MAG TPA: SMI1/KNR4 family protein [Fimbriimonadaceae bacterium]|nr:SMI1/KNR4 family protein [Fimbriimonadaceae bacterium]
MNDFWSDVVDESSGPPLTDEMVRAAEQTLGVRLPAEYLRLLRIRNGGYPRRGCFPADSPNSWADDHVRVETIWGVGHARGIEGPRRHKLADRGAELPGVVVFADTPSGGHDFLVFDYRACGPEGEPQVAHVETEGDVGEPLVVAPNFEAFARGLVDCSPYDEALDADDDESDNEPGRPWWRFW